MNNEDLKSNLLSAGHWMRFVFMILFFAILFVANTVMKILVLVQFLFALITGNDNPNLRQFGDALSQFVYAILRFLTYNTEDKPYPFAAWPEAAPIPEAEAVADEEPSSSAENTSDNDDAAASENTDEDESK